VAWTSDEQAVPAPIWARATAVKREMPMNMMNINVIQTPSHAANDPNYETDLKAVLDPVLENLLDRTEAAGWERPKAAYTVMFLAARQLSDGKSIPKPDV
jgi:hypothetical protein